MKRSDASADAMTTRSSGTQLVDRALAAERATSSVSVGSDALAPSGRAPEDVALAAAQPERQRVFAVAK